MFSKNVVFILLENRISLEVGKTSFAFFATSQVARPVKQESVVFCTFKPAVLNIYKLLFCNSKSFYVFKIYLA